jgi:dCMP deaminase
MQIEDSALQNKDQQEWMATAKEVGSRSNCVRRSVGAVLVKNGSVISKGWNGVSADFADCRAAGCPRCIRGGETGSGYESCICIHAEQRAIAHAARNGIDTSGCTMYVTLRPCLQCLAISIAAGVTEVVYSGEEWEYPPDVEQVYHILSDQFETFRRVEEIQSSGITPVFGVMDLLENR